MSTANHRRLGLLAAILLAGSVLAVPKFAVAVDTATPPAPPTASSGNRQAGQRQEHKEPKRTRNRSSNFSTNTGTRTTLIYRQRRLRRPASRRCRRSATTTIPSRELIGYASRKLGRYDESKLWYEKALAADPNHVRTWSYYGMWHAEQGNALMAQDTCRRSSLICGNDTCEEYVKLKGVIEGTTTY